MLAPNLQKQEKLSKGRLQNPENIMKLDLRVGRYWGQWKNSRKRPFYGKKDKFFKETCAKMYPIKLKLNIVASKWLEKCTI